MSKKNIYILPAWGDTTEDKSYQYLISKCQEKGYAFKRLNVITRNPDFSLGSDESFRSIISSIRNQIIYSGDDDVIIGFSIGALLAYQVTTEIKFKTAIFGSISTMLGKYLKSLPRKEFSDLSDNQYSEMSNIEFIPTIAEKPLFFCGSMESDFMKKSCSEIAIINRTSMIEIVNQDHIFDEKYIDKILHYLN